MAIEDSFYVPREKRIIRSSLDWEKGVEEVGGPDKVASLDFLTSEKQKMDEAKGKEITGRVRNGILVLNDNYIAGVSARRIILANGLALNSPKEATEINRAGKWYSPNREQQAVAILRALNPEESVLINEADVKDDVLVMPLNEKSWLSEYTLRLFGGKNRNETQAKEARKYFVDQLRSTNKPAERISLYLPTIKEAEKIKAPIATQIWVGGLAYDFNLDGYDRNLYLADGVLGVRE